MKLRRRTKLLLACGALLLTIQVVTYWLFAEQAMPGAALRQLRDYRWLERSRFAFFPQDWWDSLTPSQREAVARELKRHVAVIYHSESEIPETSLHTRPITDEDWWKYKHAEGANGVEAEILEGWRREIELGRKIVGYKDGVCVQWALCRGGPFWMQSRAYIWASVTGAEMREVLYVWLFGWWVRVWNFAHPVA